MSEKARLSVEDLRRYARRDPGGIVGVYVRLGVAAHEGKGMRLSAAEVDRLWRLEQAIEAAIITWSQEELQEPRDD